VVTFLTFSALMYLVARQGALIRFRDHVRAPRGMLDRHFGDTRSQRLTVLIPSYAEEPDVVRLTLWSAALQEYPYLDLVLLIDDPPHPTDPDVLAKLEATRRLAPDIEQALQEPRQRFAASLDDAVSYLASHDVDRHAVSMLLGEYRAAVRWLEQMAQQEDVVDHVSEFFVDQVLIGLANELNLTAIALQAALDQDGLPAAERVEELHRRLAWIFRADLSSFERKRYSSLSVEANKAMNVNSYLGLMGHVWRPHETAAGLMLDEVSTPLLPPCALLSAAALA
jgi:cellulose synthase/poly-beta-1,6-N-acetylglucosamine synthase-like glycosyltransferase